LEQLNLPKEQAGCKSSNKI